MYAPVALDSVIACAHTMPQEDLADTHYDFVIMHLLDALNHCFAIAVYRLGVHDNFVQRVNLLAFDEAGAHYCLYGGWRFGDG